MRAMSETKNGIIFVELLRKHPVDRPYPPPASPKQLPLTPLRKNLLRCPVRGLKGTLHRLRPSGLSSRASDLPSYSKNESLNQARNLTRRACRSQCLVPECLQSTLKRASSRRKRGERRRHLSRPW